jgi:predicted TPR repeat methyltransferase
LSGLNPEHPADEYVRQTFDQYAATFDQALVANLQYRVPRELVGALLAGKLTRARPWDVLDLGCGTGLVGTEISSHSRSLVGVDLSRNMIERARERQVYSELMCCDISTALCNASARSVDVVTAADVFIYVGKLDSVIAEVRRVLRPGGLFAFSAESADEQAATYTSSLQDGYVLSATGRYLHTSAYLEGLSVRNHFDAILMRRTQIRLEGPRPVIGWLLVWAADPLV